MFEDWPPPEPDTLEPTWWIFDSEPGMDDRYDKATRIIDEMSEKLGIYPFQKNNGGGRLFSARYEFPKYQEGFEHQDALMVQNAIAWIDYLSGFPMECVEMMGVAGGLSTKEGDIAVKPGGGAVAPPIPDSFFEGIPQDKLLMNLLFLPEDQVDLMAESLSGEPEPENLHWWIRTNLPEEGLTEKYPTPGEFLCLVVRIMPDKPWGNQLSSPFIWSGNFMDTVYYTSGIVKEIIEPDDDHPYHRYMVLWRGEDLVEMKPSDFTEYKVDDRVAILKDVSTEKKTQLWKDSDAEESGDCWVIAPITFYEQEEAQP